METSTVSWMMKFSADADILKKMVVDACVNIGVPEALDKNPLWLEASINKLSPGSCPG